MQIKEVDKENAQLTLEVEIPEDKVQEAFSRAFKKVAQQVDIPGFRKGKVPRKIIEQKYGKEIINEEAVKQLYSAILPEILKKKKITPLIPPRAETVEFTENKPALVKLSIVTKPEVKLGSYKDVKVKRKKVKVSDDEVSEQLKKLQKQQADYPPLLENRPTQEGDVLTLQMEGFSEGQIGPVLREDNFWYQLGSEQLPLSFHKQLMGANVGDERRIETVIPPEHPQKELAGKKVQFNVKVKDIRKEKLPPLNDEFARKLNFDNVDKLKQRVKEELRKIKERKEEERLRGQIVEKIVKDSKLDVPSLLIEETTEDKINKLKEDLEKKKTSFSEYLAQQNLTEDKFRNLLTKQTENELKTFFVLDEIAREEKIEVTEKDVDHKLESFARGENKQAEVNRLKNELIKNEEIQRFAQRIRNEKVIEFLYNNAQISG